MDSSLLLKFHQNLKGRKNIIKNPISVIQLSRLMGGAYNYNCTTVAGTFPC